MKQFINTQPQFVPCGGIDCDKFHRSATPIQRETKPPLDLKRNPHLWNKSLKNFHAKAEIPVSVNCHPLLQDSVRLGSAYSHPLPTDPKKLRITSAECVRPQLMERRNDFWAWGCFPVFAEMFRRECLLSALWAFVCKLAVPLCWCPCDGFCPITPSVLTKVDNKLAPANANNWSAKISPTYLWLS